MSVVTRFAPSPTGYLHIGGARTALYNWLFARHYDGKFLLRIEDTDRARHSDAAVAAIIQSMDWLGLGHDDEIVYQSQNAARHVQVARELLAAGKAYYCYCTPEELELMRSEAQKEGRVTSYDRRWRDRDPSDAPADIKPVIRIKAPLEGETVINDAVQGEIRVQNTQLDDFILLRSDGSPTYMLSVVVDDYDMKVTHIIRGDDHINNAFRQRVIIDAMGWPQPVYAHIPLIHGPDGAKLSKRHGAASVEEYKDQGYLPDAVNNYLLRLGWSHGDEEIIPQDKAIEWFTLDTVGRSPSRFDFDKLAYLNAHYIKDKNDAAFAKLLSSYLPPGHQSAFDRIQAAAPFLKDRGNTLVDIAKDCAFLVVDKIDTYDEKAKKNLQGAEDVLAALRDKFTLIESFDEEGIDNECRNIAGDLRDGKLGKVMMPLRAAITGTSVSPPLAASIAVLGRDEAISRLDAAIKYLAAVQK